MAHQRKTRYGDLEWETLPPGSLGPIEWDGTQEWTEVEHDPVGDHETQGRLWFMTFAGLFARNVFAELRRDCYPFFIEYARLYTQDRRLPPEGMMIESTLPVPVIISLTWASLSGEEGRVLRDAILVWSTRWNLNADWCREHALNNMLRWLGKARTGQTNDYDEIDERALIELRSIGPRSYENAAPTVGPPPGMFPFRLGESVPSYLQFTEDLANDQIERSPLLSNAKASHRRAFVRAILDIAVDYVRKVREQYELERGVKLVVGRAQNIRDLQWAVQFQVLKLSYTQIAGDDFQVSTVMRAVKRMLEEIGVPERPDSGPGRPAGRGDSPDSRRQRLKRRLRPRIERKAANEA